jgi:hypothetical protein
MRRVWYSGLRRQSERNAYRISCSKILESPLSGRSTSIIGLRSEDVTGSLRCHNDCTHSDKRGTAGQDQQIALHSMRCEASGSVSFRWQWFLVANLRGSPYLSSPSFHGMACGKLVATLLGQWALPCLGQEETFFVTSSAFGYIENSVSAFEFGQETDRDHSGAPAELSLPGRVLRPVGTVTAE